MSWAVAGQLLALLVGPLAVGACLGVAVDAWLGLREERRRIRGAPHRIRWPS